MVSLIQWSTVAAGDGINPSMHALLLLHGLKLLDKCIQVWRMLPKVFFKRCRIISHVCLIVRVIASKPFQPLLYLLRVMLLLLVLQRRLQSSVSMCTLSHEILHSHFHRHRIIDHA